MATNSPSTLTQPRGSHWFSLHNGELRIPLRPQPASGEQIFVLDIYSALANKHPELHLGWWAWPRELAIHALEIVFVYQPSHEVAAYLVTPSGTHPAQNQWVNADYQLTAFQQVSLIWYNDQHIPRKQAVVVMTVQDMNLLQSYYTDHAQWYTAEQPFALAFHQRRLAVLTRLFHKYIRPGNRVLDVGSGHSFFFLTNEGKWPYSIICIDLDQALMKQVAPDRTRFTWMVGAIQHLPFADATFDAVYAGEVIEHVQDGDVALDEWRRVLRPQWRYSPSESRTSR
jgi:2-polyprenyl-3-methyl-5-hydroxy-6-metoxy-1,4-benzoquinol methylase